ncbi:MAG: hypothetical protein ACKO2N_06975, partial [Tabrizicola sp.]
DWAMAHHLKQRFAYIGGDYPAQAEALMVERLKLDDPAAWMALTLYTGIHLPPDNRGKADQERVDRVVSAAGFSPADGLARMTAMIPILQTIHRSASVVDGETARTAAGEFATEAEFTAVTTFCETRCPSSAKTCAAAYVAGFGHPQGKFGEAQPLVSLISPEDFFSSPRGQKVFLASTHQLSGTRKADSPVQIALREIDICLADAILASHP